MDPMTQLRPPLSAADEATILRALGGDQLLVMPTDTVYGIASNPTSTPAVEALLAAKGRGRDMPSPVLVDSVQTALELASDVPDWALRLMHQCWPGGLTLVFNRSEKARAYDLGDAPGTIAVRMPDHPLALEILCLAGPLAVTSANLTGQPAATTCAQAQAYFGQHVSVYCDGGPTDGPIPSTIVDATGADPKILRTGVLSFEQIQSIISGTAGE